MTHADLVLRAKAWLRRQRFQVVVGEVTTVAQEIPDAIGFSPSKNSTLVECKCSRADFLADSKKFFRRNPGLGMGRLRYFMTPPGLISVEELPQDWGLLYAHPRKIEVKASATVIHGELVDRQDGILMASLLMRVNLVCDGGLDGVLSEYIRRNREMLERQREFSRAQRDRDWSKIVTLMGPLEGAA